MCACGQVAADREPVSIAWLSEVILSCVPVCVSLLISNLESLTLLHVLHFF